MALHELFGNEGAAADNGDTHGRRLLDLPPSSIVPTPGRILRNQGSRDPALAPEPVRSLLEDALELLRSLARPRALYHVLSTEDLRDVYQGAAANEHPAPLDEILPRVESAALFAVTLGPAVDGEIRRLFRTEDAALGCMLDGAASEGTDGLVQLLARIFRSDLTTGEVSFPPEVLPYSPGHCGWNVTGQRTLFEVLGPEEIGLELLESCLIVPIKSVTGALVAGPASIHGPQREFLCCRRCRSRVCRRRIASVTPA